LRDLADRSSISGKRLDGLLLVGMGQSIARLQSLKVHRLKTSAKVKVVIKFLIQDK
jgi:hypothetical protein